MDKSRSSLSDQIHRLRFMESLIIVQPRTTLELSQLLTVSTDTVRRDAGVLKDMGSDIEVNSFKGRKYSIRKPVFASNISVLRNNSIRECIRKLSVLIEDDK